MGRFFCAFLPIDKSARMWYNSPGRPGWTGPDFPLAHTTPYAIFQILLAPLARFFPEILLIPHPCFCPAGDASARPIFSPRHPICNFVPTSSPYHLPPYAPETRSDRPQPLYPLSRTTSSPSTSICRTGLSNMAGRFPECSSSPV